MKKIIRLTYNIKSLPVASILFGCLFLLTATLNGQTIIWTEDFETNGNTINGGDGRYSSPNDFYDSAGDDDYFGRVNGTTEEYYLTDISTGLVANSVNTFGGFNGNFFYSGEDLDDTGASIGNADGNDVKQILFSGINIAGATGLVFKGLFGAGANQVCGSSVYDANDYLEVYYNIDGAGEVLGLCFNPDLECNIPGDITNEPLYHDPNCDGDGGEGNILSSALAEFNFSIAGIGNSIDIRVEVHAESSSEEIAFDFFRLESNTPLPVVLDQFEVDNQESQVILNWTTQSEHNNAGFQIQRSVDGVTWDKIGFAQGQGNAAIYHNYQFIDTRPLTGQSFYRLRQLDFDGSEDISKVVAINRQVEQLSFTLAPNPFDQVINLNVSKSFDHNTPIEILDYQGKRVDTFLLEEGQLNHTLDLGHLNAGIFFLRFLNDNEVITRKIIKL